MWFCVLPVDEAVMRLHARDLPARAACITFDDGYADNQTVAAAILKRHGLCATFFVATGFLDGGRMWNDTITETVRCTRRSALILHGPQLNKLGSLAVEHTADRRNSLRLLIRTIKYMQPADRQAAISELMAAADVDEAGLPNNLMMTADQVRALRAAGMQVGAHTVNHPILARLSETEARWEISEGKQFLEDLLQEPVSLFAYPNGRPGEDYTARDVALVRDIGFAAAVSTAPGAAGPVTDLYQIPRFTPWDRSRWRFGLRLARQLVSRPPEGGAG